MSKFSEFANKRVAGVPVLYLAAAFVTILAIVAWKLKPATPPAEATGDESTTAGNVPVSPDDPNAADYSQLASNGTVTVVQSPTAPQEAVKQTNDDWSREAVSYLVDANLATPGVAQSAITKYVEGDNLSFDEGKLRDAAIVKLKLPPEPLTTVGTTAPESAKKQFQTFPGKHKVTGNNDNTPWRLAALYYGVADALHADSIVAANPGMGSSTYNVGTLVNIPNYSVPGYYTITGKNSDIYPTNVAKKNGISYAQVLALNPKLVAPYKVGSKVRVR